MTSKPDLFSVTQFSLAGFLKISDDKIKNGGDLLFLQKNQVEFNTQWKVAIGVDLAILEINATYEPTSKLDFSKLATYKATQNYTFTDIDNLKNEKEEIEKVAVSFHKELSKEYNNRLKGTKVEIPFPVTGQQQLDQFRERTILSLHKALERLKNFPRM
jgi:hypothetical protein